MNPGRVRLEKSVLKKDEKNVKQTDETAALWLVDAKPCAVDEEKKERISASRGESRSFKALAIAWLHGGFCVRNAVCTCMAKQNMP